MTKKAKAKLLKLIADCGLNVSTLAKASEIGRATLSNKVNGYRPWFADEVAAVAGALDGATGDAVTFGDRREVRIEELESILGSKNIMLRGSLAEHVKVYR